MFSLHRAALRRAQPSRVARHAVRFNSTSSSLKTPENEKTPTVIFSGIQPTGIPHLGNYLGALRSWVNLQNSTADDASTTRLFSIVDLHAITVRQNPDQLRQWRKEMLASFLAVGLEPSKSIVFHQSAVPQHAELMWILSCGASMGYLGRMTQWKSKMALPDSASPFDPDKSTTSKSRDATKLGLFSYPVLQAADILLYGTTHVPVGEDQAQHLEFSRELAISFNHSIAESTSSFSSTSPSPVFVAPQTILSPAKRVMSLSNPLKKMSKSDPDPRSRILITDSASSINQKIKKAMTDSIDGISYSRTARPGVSNLIDLMVHMDPSITLTPEEFAVDMKDLSMRALKEKVAETVNKGLEGVREKYLEVSGKEGLLERIGDEAAERAKGIAEKRMIEVRKAMGLL